MLFGVERRPYVSVHQLYKLTQRLKHLCDELDMKWRDIGEMPEFNGVSFGTLNAIYHGRDPKLPSTRRKLGLPTIENIEQVRGPDGRFSKRSG